jgi:hypothetical protein
VRGFNGKSVRGMAAGPKALWLATGAGDDGELWRSTDGKRWALYQKFPGIRLHGVGVFDGQVYVGGANTTGGVLLGLAPRRTDVKPARNALKALPRGRPLLKDDPAEHLQTLKQALSDPGGYDRRLRVRFGPLALSEDPKIGAELGRMLTGTFPNAEATMFGSRRFPAAKMARWYILWAMAHNGHGRVPVELITAPWEVPKNGAEKYFESAPAAAWAAAELGQKDDKTLAALISRLDRPRDPDWLKGDIIGALTVLTDKRFAYDIAAWQRWWRAQRKP